jgi:hypothetical protein
LGSDGQNNIYTFTENRLGSSEVQRFDSSGHFLNRWNTIDENATAMLVDQAGLVYIQHTHHGTSIDIYDAQGVHQDYYPALLITGDYAFALDPSHNLYFGLGGLFFTVPNKTPPQILYNQQLPACCINAMAIDKYGAIYVVTNLAPPTSGEYSQVGLFKFSPLT